MNTEYMDMNELGKEDYSMNMRGNIQPGKSKGPSPLEMADIVIKNIKLHPSFYNDREKMYAFLDAITNKLVDEVESGGLQPVDYDQEMLDIKPSSLNENKKRKMKKNPLNTEVNRIKNMMKKINEGMFSDSGEFLGGSNPEWENESGDEYFGEAIDEFTRRNFPDLFDNIEHDYSYSKNRHGDDETRIKITLKDGSPLPEEFINAISEEFDISDVDDNYVVVKRSYSGDESGFD